MVDVIGVGDNLQVQTASGGTGYIITEVPGIMHLPVRTCQALDR
jgi:hypothetical protein